MRRYKKEDITKVFNLKGKFGGEPVVSDSGDLQACCPFPHVDTVGKTYYEDRPSFGINLKSGKWNCFSCGKKGLSVVDMAKRLSVPLPPMMRYIVRTSDDDEDAAAEKTSMFDYIVMNEDKVIEYFKSRSIVIDKSFCEEYMLSASSKGKHIYFPLRDIYSGKVEGWVERWVGAKDGSRWSIQPEDLRRGKYLFAGYNAYHKSRGQQILVTESTTDTVAMLRWGYPAVGTVTATVGKGTIESLLEVSNKFILVPQGDTASLTWLKRVASGLWGRARKIEIVPPFSEVHDVAELGEDYASFKDQLEKRITYRGH